MARNSRVKTKQGSKNRSHEHKTRPEKIRNKNIHVRAGSIQISIQFAVSPESPRNTRNITLSLLVLQTNTNFEPPTHPAQIERGLVVLPQGPTDREFFKLASSILRVRQHPRDSETRSSHSCSTPDAPRSRFYTARPIFGRHPPYQKDRPAICTLIYS